MSYSAQADAVKRIETVPCVRNSELLLHSLRSNNKMMSAESRFAEDYSYCCRHLSRSRVSICWICLSRDMHVLVFVPSIFHIFIFQVFSFCLSFSAFLYNTPKCPFLSPKVHSFMFGNIYISNFSAVFRVTYWSSSPTGNSQNLHQGCNLPQFLHCMLNSRVFSAATVSLVYCVYCCIFIALYCFVCMKNIIIGQYRNAHGEFPLPRKTKEC